MRLFNKVAIVGVGLIGGSIALDIKRKRLANKIIGVSRHRETLSLAYKRKVIDEGSQQIEVVRDADLLILATPVNTILNLAPRIAQNIRRDCIVTDVGSTKEEIVLKLERKFRLFVGSHPLAGSEKRGVVNARPGLFKDSLCILTPTKHTNAKALKKMESLWRQMGAKIFFLKPSVHDRVLSYVSHLPHVVAFSLMEAIPKEFLRFASPSLKGTTRIAASDIELWSDIFLSNSKNINKAIQALEEQLLKIKSAIYKKDRQRLVEVLKAAKSKRELLI